MNRFITPAKWMLSLLTLFLYFTPAEQVAGKSPHLKNLQAMPPLACNDLVQVSLDEFCWATLSPDMLLEDMQGAPSDYYIEVSYKGVVQSDIIFDASDINKFYDYKIWHIPSKNSCWGKVKIEDKLPPNLLCSNDTIRCGRSISPDSLGFPIVAPGLFFIGKDPSKVNGYIVSGWDACGLAYLYYEDHLVDNGCNFTFFKKIYRSWYAQDAIGNKSFCVDTICIYTPTAIDIVYPRDYDGIDHAYIHCGDVFPKLPNGNPDPSYTGHPVPKFCSTLNASYTDLKIPICPNTFKILRRWVILDWCSGDIYEHNQIIKVVDDEAPQFKAPAEFIVGMAPYTCVTDYKLPRPDSVTDCGNWVYDVYVKLMDEQTGNPLPKSKDYIVFNKTDSCYYLRGAPQGRIWIIYVVTDLCGNSREHQTEAGVVDDLLPIAICDQKTVISLTSDGTAKAFAETFDDGSIDNCGILEFNVRRMDSTCNNGTHRFGPYVEFCCLDVGNVIMIALEVTDAYGNKNTCMVEATVQEKEAPIIIAPSDLTISCEFDRSDLNVFGGIKTSQADRKPIIIRDYYYSPPKYEAGIDGYAYDNCSVTVTDTAIYDLVCNQGVIYRIFTARDKQGFVSVDTQRIFVWNPRPFSINDIKWPDTLVAINSCRSAVVHPNNTGAPKFLNTNCAQVAANYADTKLTLLDSVCYKILRKWTVVDWCQFNKNKYDGIWEFNQIIYISNSEPPTIYTCDTARICDNSAYYDPRNQNCLVNYDLTGIADDDCTNTSDLKWSYRLDIGNDGSYEPLANGNRVTGVLPVGTHKVKWIVSDQCGNFSSCDQVFILKDCKKPTPYCYSGINTVVMPTTGNITVWAKDLDINSFDNCTQKENLRFSFSEDVNNKSITYTCDSLKKQAFVIFTVRLYVTDEAGNQDYCETSIRIQDNQNVCGRNFANASGQISRADQTSIPAAEVIAFDKNNQMLKLVNTNQNGQYAFNDLLVKETEHFVVERNDFAGNGVSTYDILLIQKHILGVKELDSPYKLLAADVNNTKTITARDIADLRKVVLGVKDYFPNQKIWRFFSTKFAFGDEKEPWDGKEQLDVKDLTDQFDQLNFVGVKTGDVDNSANVNLVNQNTSRSSKIYNFNLGTPIPVAESYLIPVLLTEDINLEGFQLSLHVKENMVPVSGGIKMESFNFNAEKGTLKISWHSPESIKMNTGQVLFYLETRNVEALNSIELDRESMRPEVYATEGGVFELVLKAKGGIFTEDFFTLGQNIPNPYAGQTFIPVELSVACKAQLSVFDATGQLIHKKELYLNKGMNQISLHRHEIGQPGIYMYKLETHLGSKVRKMIIRD
ncbi:MAG: T9SS type A sorting domain-containing protein [Saprospiraceae bacterium]|nr:T9SS type A sorting domain-containing protein [Candidatus Vicinibacter affinis]